MLLLASAPRSDHDPDLCPDLEAAAPNTAAAANIAMNPITGAFADASHESAFAAQLFRMAFPFHAFLMALSVALIGWTALSVPPDLWPLESMLVLSTTLGLVGRVLVHRMDDTVRGQRLGSWTWTALVVLIVTIDVMGMVMGYVELVACGSVALQSEWTIQAVAFALVNGSHGLGFWHKLGLIGLMLLDGLWVIAFCGEVALAGEGMLVVGFVVAHLVEMHLRHSYVERVEKEQLLKEDQQRLEERMEQLQTSNERLLYDNELQRRRSSSDDGDERSAIRRGLQAGPAPSLPPGPPSSTSSGATAPSLHTWAKPTAPPPTVAELAARHVEQEVAHVLLSCARGQNSHQCQSAGVAGAACSGVTATAVVPSAASIPLVAPNYQWHARSGDLAHGGGVTATPTPSVAPTHTPTSSVAAAAAFNELTGSLGCNQSNTNCLTASDGVPTPEQALLVARRDILVAKDQIHVHQVVRTLGMALGATRMEAGSIRALHAVLLQQARPGMNDGEAYRSTGASRSNFAKWRRRVQHIQSAGGAGGSAVSSTSFEHLPPSVRYFINML